MSNIKYTKDGKKVNVVGKLNNADYIVQEVFVTDDGAEIPAGENFVVSSLLDEPVKSWKEKRLEELEAGYKTQRAQWETSIDRLNKEMRLKHDFIKEHCRAAQALLSQSNPDLIDSLVEAAESLMAFISGEITYLFIDGYRPEIQRFDEAVIDEDREPHRIKVDGLKLITLFGMTDGSLQWQLNRYRDGSGDWRPVCPCRTYEDALELAQSRLDELAEEYVAGKRKSLDLDYWREIEGIEIPAGAQALQDQAKAESLRKAIEKQQAELEKNRQTLKSLNQ